MAEITRRNIAVILSVVLVLVISFPVLLSSDAYAAKDKKLVSFTVYHQDKDGNNLADTQVFFGHPGEKPVVTCREIEGYEPQVKELTGTLSSDESENVFTFVYKTKTKSLLGIGETSSEGKGGNTIIAVIFALICIQIIVLLLIFRHIKKRR